MYIINNINRPLGIHTYGVQKKYQNDPFVATQLKNRDITSDKTGRYKKVGTDGSGHPIWYDSEQDGFMRLGLLTDAVEFSKNDFSTKNAFTGDVHFRRADYRKQQKNKPIKSKNQTQTFNTARQHNYDKSVEYRWYNGTWQARYTKGKDTNWYNVAEGSTGYDRFGNHNRFVNGKWVKIKEDNSTGGNVSQGDTGSTSQKSRLDPNRFVSIYDTTGLWKQHAQDNNLTDRDSVRRFQKEVLGFDDTQADGIWGRNTEAAYSKWKANKDAATLQLNSPVKQITISNTPISRWDTNENLKGRFNNYASMQNYVNSNPEDSFSKAMITRFGNTNTWNQQDIENALDVAGTYRGSDRRDIANSFNNYYQQQQKTNNNIKNIINNTNQTMNNWKNFTSNLGIFKNGGLISRNPITRFKQGGMLRKLQNGYKIVGTDDQGYPIYQAVDSNVQAQIEAQAAKEVQDFLNSIRASKQQQQQQEQQEQEFSPIDAINTWKNIITIPKKEVTTKSQKRSSKNNSNKKNKSSQSQKKITVTTTYAKDPAQFPVDPMPPISEYEAPQWGRIRTPIAPYQQTRPYSLRQQGLRPNRYGLGDDYYKKTMGFVAP